jgi:hypothetical protein
LSHGAVYGTVFLIRAASSLIGAPSGLRAMSDRPTGPGNALCF